jgi:tRNA G18 (ribose-2'-O)-methylase SpoU
MFNAPLIKIRQFNSVQEFIAFAHVQGLSMPGEESAENTCIFKTDGTADINTAEGGSELVGKRGMVAVEMTDASLDISSSEALAVLQKQALYLVMGAESGGVDQALLDCCSYALEIPSLSASVNVSCATSMALTAMLIADRSA